MKPLIALCIGHSRKVNGHPEGGAVSIGHVSEHTYNLGLAESIAAQLATFGNMGVRAVIVSEYEGTGYGAAQRWLASHLKGLGVNAALELHFNDSDSPQSNGHEMLFWNTSTKGKLLATHLEQALDSSPVKIRPRGVIPKYPGDRGAEFLKGTHCPAVIVETGFGSNAGDWMEMTVQKAEIARAYAIGIAEFFD